MRIAWLTPLSRRCGISKYSLGVIPQLVAIAELEVWAPGADDDYPCPWADVRPLRVDTETVAALRGYDVVVLNAGNNPSFHTEIQGISERLPGIVVVHDKRMHGFFFDVWAVHRGDPARYAAMMRYYYGTPGEAAAADVLASRTGVDADPRFPLVEPAIWNAKGIVVHSAEAARLVSRYGDLVPVVALGLPFDLGALPDLGDLPSREELLGPDGGRVLVVSSGGVFEQKRLESVIRAIASEPDLSKRVLLAIVGGGRPEYAEKLRVLALQLGVSQHVTLTGYVDDRVMYGWLAAADVAVNLRFPSMESSSLSLVEQMAFGCPLVVSDTSYYSELPDDVAFKVPVDDAEFEGLTRSLLALVDDAALRERMGSAARTFAAKAHDARTYASSFLEFAERTLCSEGPTR